MKFIAKYIQDDRSHVIEDIEDLENIIEQNTAIIMIFNFLLQSFDFKTIEKVKRIHPKDFNDFLAEYRNKEIEKFEKENQVSEYIIEQLKSWRLPGAHLKFKQHINDMEKTLKKNKNKLQKLIIFKKKQKR